MPDIGDFIRRSRQDRQVCRSLLETTTTKNKQKKGKSHFFI